MTTSASIKYEQRSPGKFIVNNDQIQIARGRLSIEDSPDKTTVQITTQPRDFLVSGNRLTILESGRFSLTGNGSSATMVPTEHSDSSGITSIFIRRQQPKS